MKDGREVVVCSDGRSIPVVRGVLRGRVERDAVIAGRAVFTGWAADVDHSRRVERVVIFADGEYLRSGETFVDRDDIVRSYGVSMAGFYSGCPWVMSAGWMARRYGSSRSPATGWRPNSSIPTDTRGVGSSRS